MKKREKNEKNKERKMWVWEKEKRGKNMSVCKNKIKWTPRFSKVH
jgi:hypothetical protein